MSPYGRGGWGDAEGEEGAGGAAAKGEEGVGGTAATGFVDGRESTHEYVGHSSSTHERSHPSQAAANHPGLARARSSRSLVLMALASPSAEVIDGLVPLRAVTDTTSREDIDLYKTVSTVDIASDENNITRE